MRDIYSGDPLIRLTNDGAEFMYKNGQPVMDQGFENCAILSLFTRNGWCGNVFHRHANQVGSDFEKVCLDGALTLAKIADIENSAERALSAKVFGTVRAEATNPTAESIVIDIKIGSGGALSLRREKALWQAQINNPGGV